MDCRRGLVTAVIVFSAAFGLTFAAEPPTASPNEIVHDLYTAVEGVVEFDFDPAALHQAGLAIVAGSGHESPAAGLVSLELDPQGPMFQLTTVEGEFQGLATGEFRADGPTIAIVNTRGDSASLKALQFVYTSSAESETDRFVVYSDPTRRHRLFHLLPVKASFTNEAKTLMMMAQVIDSSDSPPELGDAAAADTVLGTLMLTMRMRLNQSAVYGSDGEVLQVIMAAPDDQPPPEGGNNGTQCGKPVGPDVIVGDLVDVSNDASLGGIESFAVGTTSCNIGDANLNWVASTNQHPVIGQTMYRLKNDKFEQIGQSWLKHGFTALTENICGCGCSGQGGSVLGVGCSDPYCCGLNGNQGRLGPKSEVNAFTGNYPYPWVNRGSEGDCGSCTSTYKRLQVNIADLDPAQAGGGSYFVEGHYVAPDDATNGNGRNNASYRSVTVSGSGSAWSIALNAGTTQREQAAIRAWKDTDPTVTETDISISSEGLLVLASKAISVGGGFFRYEYALQNLNSDRSVGSFSIPIPSGTTVQNVGFHDVDYHSGEPYVTTDWTPTVTGSSVSWACQTFAQNANANALRWNTTYNFRFEANVSPSTVTATLGLFKAGSPASVTGNTVGPTPGLVDCNSNGIQDTTDIANGTSQDCDASGVPDECETFTPCTLGTVRVASGLTNPLGVVAPKGDASRVFIVEQGGRIKILTGGSVLATPYLDISSIISSGGERGLLGVAFDPNFNTNAFFYVDYTNTAGNTVIARYQATGANPASNTANAASATIMKTIVQPESNHNGGQLQFGKDNMLYVGMGDGGSGNDPHGTIGNGQDTGTLLGKILRLDPNNPPTYVPASNPFVGAGNPLDEIWAIGMRNPWRFSFDRLKGDLYIGDVGQDAHEEIDFQAVTSTGGENYGWRCMEGNSCTGLTGCTCNAPTLKLPILDVPQNTGDGTCSITGGYVYRGCDIPFLSGTYFFADYCGDYIRSFKYTSGGAIPPTVTDRTSELTPDVGSLTSIVSFGEDGLGEMYIVSLAGGSVFKLVCEVVPECGNGIVEAGEQCDDNNTNNGDGCSSTCQNEVTGCGLVIFNDDFETNMNWTVGDTGDNATTGIWTRVNPNGTAAQPEDDHTTDPAVTCFVTGQGTVGGAAGENDVDGGKTTLKSPVFDLSAGDATVSYWRWYSNSSGAAPNADTFAVDIANDGGTIWTNVETVGPTGAEVNGGWIQHTFDVSTFVSPTAQVRLRFVASDVGSGSIIEAGIDDFNVCRDITDCNNNGIPDDQDIANATSEDCNFNGIPDECEVAQLKDYTVIPNPPVAIPDGTGAFVSSTVNIPDSGTINDVNLDLQLSHTYNGDITVTLSHGGTTITLIDRPGYTGTGFGTDNDGFDITLDDEGAGGAIEDANSGGPLLVSPPSYLPHQALSAFDSMDKIGDWTIAAADFAGADTGSIDQWTLHILNQGIVVPPCMIDCNGNEIDDADDIANCTGQAWCTDCNNNDIPDKCDIADATSVDCNGGPIGQFAGGQSLFNFWCMACHGPNGQGATGPSLRDHTRKVIWEKLLSEYASGHPGGVHDEFTMQDFANLEVFFHDTGGRGRPDRIPDECQAPLPNCDGDATPDACELLAGTQVDANHDGVPDTCVCIEPCDDNNVCTVKDACVGNQCQGSTYTCGTFEPDCVVFSCDPNGDLEGNCGMFTLINQGQPCHNGTGICVDSVCEPLGPRVRVFMAADGEEGSAPQTGNTSIVMDSGGTRSVMVWMQDTAGADLFNGYQIIVPWNATLTSGSGSAQYNDVPPTGPPGDSVFVDANRSDWVFAGQPPQPVFYQEVTGNRFGFIGGLAFGSGIDTSVLGIRYVGEFELTAAAGTCGQFELPFRTAPPPASLLFNPQGNTFAVDEFQTLTVTVGATNDDCADATPVSGNNVTLPFDSTCATPDGVAHPGCSIDDDLWYLYTATCSGTLTVSTTSNCTFDTAIAVYDNGAPCVPGGAALDTCANTSGSCESAAVPVSFGQTRLIRVGSITGAHGAGTLTITCTGSGGPCNDTNDCADGDSNNIRDDNCVWWTCGGNCSGLDIVFGDMGGVGGACMPDGTADFNDAYHALRCFANLDVTGQPPYPCDVVNTDVGGPGLSCCPDGTCDANDAFAALNAFSGSTSCSCPLDPAGTHSCPPGGPAPIETPAAAAHATITATAERRTAQPGDLVAVNVFMENPLVDLRGYQLHLGVSGGKRGGLELVNVAVAARADYVFAGRGAFDAFNVQKGQMIAGLSGQGVATAGRGYLATFTYRVSDDAAGAFVVDVLGYDAAKSDQRTFLFGSGEGNIALDSTKPAMIVVASPHAEGVRASR